jgi:hypothetical protein
LAIGSNSIVPGRALEDARAPENEEIIMEETVETQLEQVSAIIEIAAEFAISYGL